MRAKGNERVKQGGNREINGREEEEKGIMSHFKPYNHFLCTYLNKICLN